MGQPSFTVYVDYVGTPHTFIRLDDGRGIAQYFGFAPSSAGSPHGPGNVGEGLTTHFKGDPHNKTAGYMDDVGWSKSIAIDSKQYESMRSAVDIWKAAGHAYNGLATLGGENCTTFVQAIARAGGITEIVTSRAPLPISLIPANERAALFARDEDGRRSFSDAMKDPLRTPGTPAYEFKRTNPELFEPSSDGKPAPDSMASTLLQNNDGSFTEVLEQSDGDSQTNEYTFNGVATASTESDGARNDSDYASRVKSYDAEGREDSQRVTLDDGAVHWKDFDQKNERGDRTWESLTDAQGREDWHRVTHDDGAVHWKDFDQKNERGDRTWESLTDAQGREDWHRVTHDDGAVHWKDFDQKKERGDRTWESLTDAQGRDDWHRVTHDDGAVHWKDFDQRNERGDRTWENLTDAQGREDWRSVTNDDGTRDWTDYDANNTQNWSRIESRFDAQGREDDATVYHDTGGMTVINYDADDSQSWSRITTLVDAWGTQISSEITFDNGWVNPMPRLSDLGEGIEIPWMPFAPGTACVQALDEWSCEPR